MPIRYLPDEEEYIEAVVPDVLFSALALTLA